jgi:hypothetical protein
MKNLFRKPKTETTFKKCTSCGYLWQLREDFLDDPTTAVVGYQVNFDHLHLGLILFNHLKCGTTLAIPADKFKDLYNGPIYNDRLTGTEQCNEHCLHEKDLEPCPEKCECAYVREILQIVRRWPKNV